jgi:ubiquinone/menaquinone biosynthesis C-methylase UbiE
MIHFHVDLAGFDGHIKCGTINYFNGWAANPDDHNPISHITFSVGPDGLGDLPVRQERPDLDEFWPNTFVGFAGTIGIPDTYLGQTLTLVAVASDGQTFPLTEHVLTECLSNEERCFRKEHELPDDLLMHLVVHDVDPKRFLAEGKAAVELVQGMLERHQINIDGVRNVLDFGVGCGRVLRWWTDQSHKIQFWGTDINPCLVEWCRQHLPFANVSVNLLYPPTSYQDAQFDLVYAFSVFTHLAPETQTEWLGEFHRIIAPRKHLLLSSHGDFHAQLLGRGTYEKYQQDGYVVISKCSEGENLCASYQNKEFTARLLSEYFEILDFYPSALASCGNQDLYLLKRR